MKCIWRRLFSSSFSAPFLVIPRIPLSLRKPLPSPTRAECLRIHLRYWMDNNGPKYVDGLAQLMEVEGCLLETDRIQILRFYLHRKSLFRLWPHFQSFSNTMLPKAEGIEKQNNGEKRPEIVDITYLSVFRDVVLLLIQRGYIDRAIETLSSIKPHVSKSVLEATFVELTRLFPAARSVVMPTPNALKNFLLSHADQQQLHDKRKKKKTPEDIMMLILQLRRWTQDKIARKSDLDNSVLYAFNHFGRLDLMLEYLLVISPNADSYLLTLRLLGKVGPSTYSLQKRLFEKMEALATFKQTSFLETLSLMLHFAIQANDIIFAQKLWNRLQDLLVHFRQRLPRKSFLHEFQHYISKEALLPSAISKNFFDHSKARPQGYEFQLRSLLEPSKRYSLDFDRQAIPPTLSLGSESFSFMSECLHIVQQMNSNNVPMYPSTFTLLIEACAIHDCEDTARELWRSMRLLRVRPQLETYLAMIDLMFRCGKLLEATQLVLSLQKDGLPFTVNFRRMFLRLMLRDQKQYVLKHNYGVVTELYFSGVRRRGPSFEHDAKFGVQEPPQTDTTYDRVLTQREKRRFLLVVSKFQRDLILHPHAVSSMPRPASPALVHETDRSQVS